MLLIGNPTYEAVIKSRKTKHMKLWWWSTLWECLHSNGVPYVRVLVNVRNCDMDESSGFRTTIGKSGAVCIEMEQDDETMSYIQVLIFV